MFTAWINRWLSDPWPHAKPLPPHVAAVRLDPRLLRLHMDRAATRSDDVKTGYIVPAKGDMK